MDRKTAESLSSILTPNEIKNQEFKRTAWGYSPKEVVDYLERTAKSWEKVQKNEKELLLRIESLQKEVQEWQKREAQIMKIHEKALRDAEQIKADAVTHAEKLFEEVEKKAAEVRSQTEEWLAGVIGEVEETQRQKENFLIAFRSALDSHYAILEKEKKEDPLGAKLASFLKRGTLKGADVPSRDTSLT